MKPENCKYSASVWTKSIVIVVWLQ